MKSQWGRYIIGKPKAPTPPDPRQTSAAQTGTNFTTASANNLMGMVNKQGPNGSVKYEQRGTKRVTDPYTGKSYDVPQYVEKTTLTDKDQAILSTNRDAMLNLSQTARGQSGFLKDYLKGTVDASDLPARGELPDGPASAKPLSGNANLTAQGGFRGVLDERIADSGKITQAGGFRGVLDERLRDAGDITKTYGTDFSEDRQRVEDALLQRLNGQLDKDRAAMETRLANQGLSMGSEARSAANEDFGRNVNDARLSAILGAGQEHSRLAGLEAQRAGFENAAQSQQFGQNLAGSQYRQGVQQQKFDQSLTNNRQANAAQAQQHAQNVADSQYRQGVQQQKYSQTLGNHQNANAVNQARLENANAATAANNAISNNRFNQNLSLFNLQEQQRQQAMAEQFAYRNQPINEISALLSGTQVQAPPTGGYRANPMATTDTAGIINANYGQQMQNYNTQMAGRNNIIGGLFGLGAAGITGSLFT